MVCWAFQYMEAYKVATENLVCKATTAEGVRSWIPCPENVFKINVNGAVFVDKKAVGVGVIIRDKKGRLEAAMSKKIHVPLGTVEAEDMVFEQGLMFARDIVFTTLLLKATRSLFIMLYVTHPIHRPLWLLLYKECRKCVGNSMG